MRRLSVHVDNARVDVAVSATVPVGTLIPTITDALVATGEFSVGPVATRYRLCAPGGAVLDDSKSLAQLPIRDGTSLTLVSAMPESPAPQFDDAADAISAAVTTVEQRGNRQTARLVGTLVAGCLATAGVVALCRSGTDDPDAQRMGRLGVAVTVSVLAMTAAAIARRIGESAAGLALGLTAVTVATVAGWVAVPSGPGAANAVVAAAAAMTSTVMVCVIVCRTVLLVILTWFSAMCCVAATLCLVTAAPLPAAGAGLAAVSIALIELCPSMSIALARLSPASVEAPDQLHARAVGAHHWLTSSTTAFSATAALGSIGALCMPSRPHIVFATVTGGVLLLRSRARHDIRQSAPSVVCGAITLSAVLVAGAVANPHHALTIAALSMMLSVGTLYAGFMKVPSTARRSIDLLQYFALAAVAPLALWACGLYGAARGLNLP